MAHGTQVRVHGFSDTNIHTNSRIQLVCFVCKIISKTMAMRRMKQKQKNTHTAYHLFMLEALAVSLLCIVTCGNDEFLERPNSRNTDANRWQLFKQILSYLFWNSTKHCLPPKISSLFVSFLQCCCHTTITASASVSVSAVIFKSLHSFYFCFFSSLYCSLSLRLINTLPKFIYTQNHPCSLLHNK